MLKHALEYSKIRSMSKQKVGKLSKTHSDLLKKLVYSSYLHIPFYREFYDSKGIDIGDINNISDIEKLPIVSKVEMRDYSHRDLVSDEYDLNNLEYSASSGSTGEPFRTYFSPEDSFYRNLFTLYVYLRQGLNPFDKKGFFQNSSRAKTNGRFFQKCKILRSYPYSVDLGFSSMYNEMCKENIRILEGCPTNVYFMGEENKKKHALDIRHINTYGELLSDELRTKLQEFFPDANICDAYGLIETGHIGFECEEKNGFHINPNCYVEIAREGKVQPEGEIGDIVVTTLRQYAMPFIRYNTKDVGSIDQTPCKCGLSSPRIMDIQGRSSNFFINRYGHKIATQYFYVGTKFLEEIRQYEVLQNTIGILEITISLRPNVDQKAFEKRFIKSLEERFGDSFEFDIRYVEDMNINPSGKFWAVKSNLEVR